MDITLSDGERLDRVNDDLLLIQRNAGLPFGTDALLLAGYIPGKFDTGAEIGTGSGIISLLLLSRGKVEKIDGVEVQKVYAALAEKNAALNGFSDRFRGIFADVRDLPASGAYDLVFTNPPYMKGAGGGKACVSPERDAARHEQNGGVSELILAAGGMLRFGGTFAAVYRPDRLSELFAAMRDAKIEPKRATFVHADAGAIPSSVLILGKRGGKPGMKITPPLFTFADEAHRTPSEDYETIMQTGNFPPKFR